MCLHPVESSIVREQLGQARKEGHCFPSNSLFLHSARILNNSLLSLQPELPHVYLLRFFHSPRQCQQNSYFASPLDLQFKHPTRLSVSFCRWQLTKHFGHCLTPAFCRLISNFCSNSTVSLSERQAASRMSENGHLELHLLPGQEISCFLFSNSYKQWQANDSGAIGRINKKSNECSKNPMMKMSISQCFLSRKFPTTCLPRWVFYLRSINWQLRRQITRLWCAPKLTLNTALSPTISYPKTKLDLISWGYKLR